MPLPGFLRERREGSWVDMRRLFSALVGLFLLSMLAVPVQAGPIPPSMDEAYVTFSFSTADFDRATVNASFNEYGYAFLTVSAEVWDDPPYALWSCQTSSEYSGEDAAGAIIGRRGHDVMTVVADVATDQFERCRAYGDAVVPERISFSLEGEADLLLRQVGKAQIVKGESDFHSAQKYNLWEGFELSVSGVFMGEPPIETYDHSRFRMGKYN